MPSTEAAPMQPPLQSSPSSKTPNHARRFSSFHKPMSSPKNLPRTPLRRISANRISGRITPARAVNATPINKADSAIKTPNLRTPGTQMRDRRRSRAAPMSREEIAAMYSETIKLCQDNKITARNTWSLNLIDYMPMLFKTGRGTDSARRRTVSFQEVSPTAAESPTADTNFQLAGVTLDAGVKIYCSRVDSVHTNAFKVLGGLSRTGGQRSSGDDDGENAGSGSENEDGSGEQRSRRNGRRAGRSTLESNMGNITSHKLETDLAVDPLFQKMSAAFDEGGAKGMLLNNLPVGPSGQVIFDSGEPADNLLIRPLVEASNAECTAETSSGCYDISSALPAFPPGEADHICGTFLRFYHAKKAVLDQANASTGQDGAQTTQTSEDDYVPDHDLSQHDVDFDYANGDLQNAESLGVFNGSEPTTESFAIPDSFDDEDDVNLFNSTTDSTDRQSLQSNESLAYAARRGSMDLIEAGMALSEASEYSFFETSALTGWAGPQHWRFRATEASVNSRGELSEESQGRKKAKRPRGKTAMLLDFTSDPPDINFAKEFEQGKTETSYHLSNTVRTGLSEKKVTLPEDLHFSVRTLTCLFLKPNISVRPHKLRGGTSALGSKAEDTSAWYDYDNDCDNENFCPDDDGTFVTNPGESEFENYASLSTEVDLIPEPTRVEKIDIEYAKVAKKVDVRQLKSGIWAQLCGQSAASTQKESEEAQDPDKLDSSDPHNQLSDIRDGNSQRLQEVVQELPSVVPKTSLTDVSVPYVFICLLHLANEKTLQITQAGNGSLDDLVITTGNEGVNEEE